MNRQEVKTNGIGFAGVLQIVFIVLKLCKVINWSWWWVISPSWIYAGLVILILLVVLLIELFKK